MNIVRKPSPNFTHGRRGRKPIAIVIHIMEGTLTGTDAWFANRASRVSAYYGVGKKGEVHQYVDEHDTAADEGIVDRPSWRLLKHGVNPNYYTLGIEHEGKAGDALTEPQMAASAELIAGIAKRWNIPLDRDHIIGHHEIRFGKPCPGPGVNIDALIERAKTFTDTSVNSPTDSLSPITQTEV
jgi:N-acetylmuramoyl-L-alanine amidase